MRFVSSIAIYLARPTLSITLPIVTDHLHDTQPLKCLASGENFRTPMLKTGSVTMNRENTVSHLMP